MRFDERRLTRVVAACVIGLWPGLGTAQAATEASKALEGRWRVELMLDVTDPRHSPTSRDAKGEIAFDSASWWNPGDRWGRHALDLAPFFGRTGALPKGVTPFSATDTSLVTEVTGRMAGPMATVEFMPRSTRYGITLEGRLVGDSIVGQWHRRGMDGSGTFVMNRLSREPVRVAAINDPMLNPSLRAAATVAARTTTTTPAGRGTTRPAAAGTPARTAAQPPTAKPAATQPATTLPASTQPAATQTAAAQPPVVRPPTPQPATAQPSQAATTAPALTPATAAAAGRAPVVDPNVAGDLRVRIFDRASQKYVATAYQLQLSNEKWMWGDMKTGAGADGWGPAVKRPAGTHRVVVDNFVCGDKYWFFARPIVRPVEIRPGETAELTIEVDLTAEPAKKSYDNPQAARCAAGPGVKD